MLCSKPFFHLRIAALGAFLIVSSDSQGMDCDTLIIDSSYIYVRVDTSEIADSDSMISAFADSPMRKKKMRYYLNFSGDFLFNVNTQTVSIQGYDILENAMPDPTLLEAHRQVSMQGAAQFLRRGRIRKWNRDSFAFRNSLGCYASSLKFPVANVGNPESLKQDSIIEARIDGDDIMLSYYKSFGQGVGEVDTVFEPWQRKVLKWQLLGVSASWGMEYRRLNSPWILSMDFGLSALWLLRGKEKPPIGLISETEGYKNVDAEKWFSRRFTSYSVAFGWERILSGISDGLLKDSSIGLRLLYTSNVQLNLQEVQLSRYQLGGGVFFTIAL